VKLELTVDKQTLRPGEGLSGTVELRDYPKGVKVTVSLQGEEIVGANHLFRSYVLPILEETHTFQSTGEKVQSEPFTFQMPDQTRPSYASWDLRCQYFLKARARPRLLEEISRLHLTVLPPDDPWIEQNSVELTVDNKGIKLVALVETPHITTGDVVHGELLLSQESPEAALPERISFRLAAIEESKVSDYRKVLWVQAHDIEPTSAAELPINGFFEFPVDQTAPFTGEWNLFRVHYGLRVGLTPAGGGREERQSLPIQVFRHYDPVREEQSEQGMGLSPAPQTEL
jgi:hypothetical protein